ncbi:hypothetical protein MMC25_006710 [Agyrium rufum]|nr:hypothetical protein [Agyrium rufum]
MNHVLLSLLVSFLVIIGRSNAEFIRFEPNCTSPPPNVNYVDSVGIRGTFDIIWPCLSVLLLCIWSIQHLSVPRHEESDRHPTLHQLTVEKIKHTLKKIKWAGLTLLMPEYLFAKGMAEMLAAIHSQKRFHEEIVGAIEASHGHRRLDPEDWTTTHAFFADMQGFALRFEVAAVQTSLVPRSPPKHRKAAKLEYWEELEDAGRSQQTPKVDGGEVTYPEQNAELAELIELAHCQKYCQGSCKKERNGEWNENGEHTGKTTLNDDEWTPQALDGQISSQGLQIAGAVLSEEIQPQPSHGTTDREDFPDYDSEEKGFKRDKLGPHDKPGRIDDHVPKLERSFDMGQTGGIQNGKLGYHKPWRGSMVLCASQMLYAFQAGIISGPPSITREELNDRSKGDPIVKIAALTQILWLVIQIIARSFQGLATTLIEVTVLAFAACAIFTYLFLMGKPQDVNMPVYVDAQRRLTREDVIGLAAHSPPSSLFVREYWLHGVSVRPMRNHIFPYSPGIEIELPWLKKPWSVNTVVFGIGFGGALFGAVHFAAWNFVFPTPFEKLLWRISCIALVTLPIAGSMIHYIGRYLAVYWKVPDKKVNKILKPLGYSLAPIYFLARTYLTVEVFRSLAYLPLSAFKEVDWALAIAHIG